MARRTLVAVTVSIAASLAWAAPAAAAFGWLSQFGSGGTAEGQFFEASGIDFDAQGNVYVADTHNYRVQKFDANGNFIRTWGWGVQDGANAFQVCTSGCRAGSPGTGDGAFRVPSDVAVDSQGFVYVTEGAFGSVTNDRVQKFDGNGNFVTKFGGKGTTEGSLGVPYGLAVDAADNVYVAETENNRVSKFTSSGTFVRMWGWGVDDGSNTFQICTTTCQAGIAGYGAGQFFRVWGIAVAPNGQIYTLEDETTRVQRWDPDGGLFAQFDVSEGSGQYYLWAIDIDAAGFVYIVNNFGPFPQTVRRFTADGTLTDRVVCGPPLQGVGTHPDGRVFVATDKSVLVMGNGGSGCEPPLPTPPPDGGGGGGGGAGTTPGLTFAGSEGVSINDGARFTNDAHVVLKIVAPAGANTVRMANDGGFAGALSATIAADGRYPWALDRDPDKDERLPKTVYVRFSGSGGDSALTFTDDVILDTIPPTVAQASLSGGGAGTSGATAAKARRFTLRIRARDANSGVGQLQLAANKRKPAKARAFKAKLTFRAAKAPRYVRVRDRAGNFSKWRKLSVRR